MREGITVIIPSFRRHENIPIIINRLKSTKEVKMTNFVPSKASFAAYTKMTQGVLHNMAAKGQFKQFAGLLLAGDPGVGKTTYINFLSKLLGIEVITIEAPFLIKAGI